MAINGQFIVQPVNDIHALKYLSVWNTLSDRCVIKNQHTQIGQTSEITKSRLKYPPHFLELKNLNVPIQKT